MRLTTVSEDLSARLEGGDAEFKRISIDSRTIKAGELFVAVAGEQFDGHDFIEQAVANGACAVMASKKLALSVPLLLVNDTIEALGQLAKLKRRQHTIPTIALTGSCGKTTTKSMIAAILETCGAANSTQGSFNNHYGLPLTLFDTTPEHEYQVLELGANHLGEIAYLTAIAQPDVAMITNAAPCHLEGFGSIDGVSRGKGEIFQGLSDQGVAILNRDDHYYDYWLSLVQGKRVMSFGLSPEADVSADNIQLDEQGSSNFTLKTAQSSIDIQLPLLGEHNVKNALAAAAACLAINIPLENIQQGLARVAATTKRLVTKTSRSGARIIDDSYNANPTSMKAAIALLTQLPGEKILVIGDMGELGEDELKHHFNVGETAKKAGVNQLFAVGRLSAEAVKGFGDKAQHFPDQQSLIENLVPLLSTEQTILVKGSRSAKMENVVDALVE